MDRKKHACVDFIEVSALVGLGVENFTVEQAALKVVSCKWPNIRKHVMTINTFLYCFHSTLLDS
jgi:hypothetical protein